MKQRVYFANCCFNSCTEQGDKDGVREDKTPCLLCSTYHCHKYNFCRDKYFSRQTHACCDKHVFVTTKKSLSRQKYACRDKILLFATKRLSRICRDKHVFVGTKVISRQTYFVATKDVFCRDKHVLVATKCDKKVNRDKIMFVATNISRDTSFVATKIILVAAPADDNTTLVSGVVEASAADCDPAVHGQHPV